MVVNIVSVTKKMDVDIRSAWNPIVVLIPKGRRNKSP